MKILTLDGFYATNMGNAFYMDGAKYLIRKVFPDAELFSLGDVPLNQWSGKKCVKHSFDMLEYVDIDFLVISGPCLSKSFDFLYRRIFESLIGKKKTKLVLLSVGGYEYDSREINICRRFLKQYPPFFLSTRDATAFHHYKDLAEIHHNGICTAWFIDDYFKHVPSSLPQFITLSFDYLLEPTVNIVGDMQCGDINEHVQLLFPGKVPNLMNKVLKRTFHHRLMMNSGARDSVGDYTIIRPTHRVSYRYAHELFSARNIYVSEVAQGYLQLYKHTSLNLTDRVHSAVASLVQGRPTRLFTKSKRAKLLDRIGAADVTRQICCLDQDRLLEEKDRMFRALARIDTTR